MRRTRRWLLLIITRSKPVITGEGLVVVVVVGGGSLRVLGN